MGKCQLGTRFFVCYIRVAVISEAVINGEINIAKAWKNLGPQLSVCYMRVTVISDDVTTGHYCISKVTFSGNGLITLHLVMWNGDKARITL